MSFGWSAGDIISFINTVITISKALREHGGSKSDYQAAVTFLESVEKTLTGILYIVHDNPSLPCETSLLEQVNIVKSAIVRFDKGIKKYKKSLDADSKRGKLKAIPRAVQFALSDVKELQQDIERPQMVLNAFIGLQTLASTLEISKTSKLNLAGLENLAGHISQLLPIIANGVSTLDKDIKSHLQDDQNWHHQLEISLRSDLKQLQCLLTDINTLQISVDAENRENSARHKQWQEQFQLSLQDLVDCSKNQLDFLLKKEIAPKIADPGENEKSTSGVLIHVLLFIGNGIAGAVGTYVALKEGGRFSGAPLASFPTLTSREFHTRFPSLRCSDQSFRDTLIFDIPRRLSNEELEAINNLRIEDDTRNQQPKTPITDRFEKIWEKAILSPLPRFRVGETVWVQYNSRPGARSMHIASEGKYLGISGGWAYQLKDREGEVYNGNWVPEEQLVKVECPSFLGWWECHVCAREINPALNGYTCPDCAHNYCSSCEEPLKIP